ncbi:MAG: DUF4062 domain-containing protein [Bacteroidota bacterium]
MSKKTNTEGKKVVFISSTARDLPEHRKQVQDACHRQGYFPQMMEHLPANSENAISASLKMVDEADFYIGVFALRYGYVPDGHDISITEMEYNRAVERGIPRMVFIAGKKHTFTQEQIETVLESFPKLASFKERVSKKNIVNFFDSHEELRSLAINSLSQIPKDPGAAYKFHHISPIPSPPEPYIAHPYVLSQAKGLVGRRKELNLLTDWITGKAGEIRPPRTGWHSINIFNIVAIGGMGKSALTWEWFNKIAPQEWPQMEGRVWWSFYESDARFENFVIRTLAYVAGMSIEEAKEFDVNARENLLLQKLNETPYLIVFDGFERELIAYTRLDANRLSDDEYEAHTANWVAGAYGLPEGASQSFTGQHRLRMTADRRVGLFLKRLAQVNQSRILVSTRLYPIALQNRVNRRPIPGCFATFLKGLSDDDAVDLWRRFELEGSREELLPMFNSFGNHPLLMQALAGAISDYRPAPGDFEKWKKDNPDFNPFQLSLVQAKTHVMEFALHGLTPAERKVLHTIAAFRMPTTYSTLLGVCVGDGKPCANAPELDATLTQLEDRGLLGWNRQHDRYDLHPVVRGVVWSGTDEKEQQGVFKVMQNHFKAVPMVEDYREVNSLEDLTPAIELYNALIGLELYNEAFNVFKDKISNATLWRLGNSRLRMELMEKLFPDELGHLPHLSKDIDKASACHLLAITYDRSGELSKAVKYYEMHIEIQKKKGSKIDLAVGLFNHSNALLLSGKMLEAEVNVRQALVITQNQSDEFNEAAGLFWLWQILSTKGQAKKGMEALLRARDLLRKRNHIQGESLANIYLAQHNLWLHQPNQATIHANRAWGLVQDVRSESDFIRAASRQGQAALALGQHKLASERLHHALERARKINFVEEELPSLTALAELARQQGKPKEARDLLDQIWDAAERGPYPFFHADALNVLCQIERDAGNEGAAVAAAKEAYQLAWAQGEPHVYRYGLENAKRHLAALGVEPNIT